MQHPVRRTLGVLIVTVAATLFVVHVLANDASPNLSRALNAQQSLAVAHPSDANVHNDLGNLLVLVGELGNAERAYQRAIDLRGDFVSARFNLGLLLQQQNRPGDAQDAYESVLGIDPAHAWARYQLGVVHHERGDRRAAIEQYARAFAIDHRLAFAKHNPHIIENDLMTQALLHARKFSVPTSAQAPRQYGDPERIADLMLDDGTAAADVMPPMADSSATEARGATHETTYETKAMGVGEDEDQFFDDEDTDHEDTAGNGGVRVLSAEDLDSGSRLGQAEAGASSRSDARSRRGPGSVLERYRRTSRTPTTTRGEAAARTHGAASPTTRGRTAAGRGGNVAAERRSPAAGLGAAGRTRFTPSVRSSGNLELELRPAAPSAGPVAASAVVTR